MGWISALSGRINIHDHCGLMWLDYYLFFVCPFPLACWTQTRSTVWEKTHFRTCRISRCCLYMTTKSKLWPRALSPHCVQFRLCEYKNITIIRINIHYMNTLTGHSHHQLFVFMKYFELLEANFLPVLPEPSQLTVLSTIL